MAFAIGSNISILAQKIKFAIHLYYDNLRKGAPNMPSGRFMYSDDFIKRLEEAHPTQTDAIAQAKNGGVVSVETFLKSVNDTDLLGMADTEWKNRSNSSTSSFGA